jgi:hypothetical protein
MAIFRIVGVAAGFLVLFFSLGTAVYWVVENPAMSDPGQLAGTIFLLLFAAASVLLIRWASPGFFASLLHTVALAPRRFVRWLLLPETRRSPFGMAVWTWVVGFVLLLPPTGQARFLIALVLFLLYVLFALVALVALPGWWKRALLTLLFGPVVMSGLVIIAEGFQENVIGEGGLAFLGPLMWSWAAIPLTGLVRLLFFKHSPPSPTIP